MEIEKKNISATGIKFLATDNGRTMGRVYLYVLKNDLHDRPFGFMEDLFVEEAARGQGIGRQLIEAVIAEAKAQNCYKLICTSRHEKPEVHKLYEKFGFANHGVEFRMDM